MLEFIQSVVLTFAGLIFGGYILFFGRRALWATLGIIGLSVTANMLATYMVGADAGIELLHMQSWGLVGVAVAAGGLGILIGRFRPALAVAMIGFAAGADITLWFYEISAYWVTDVARLPEVIALVIGLALILIGGGMGLVLTRKYPPEALILITMLIGVEIIQDALGLSPSSSWTAIIIISLALAGLLVQYANYLRELKVSSTIEEPEVAASSVAIFQELDLDQ